MVQSHHSTKINKGSIMALRGRCAVRFNSERADLGGIATSLLNDIADQFNHYTFDILLTEDRQQVTYGASTDKAFTVVYHRQGGMVIWDNATHSVATITADNIPHTSIAPSKAITTSVHEKEDEILFVVMSDDKSLGAVRHEITVSRQQNLTPFGPTLLRILHCGSACHAQTALPWEHMAQSGLIIREQTFSESSNELISELAFESLDLVEVSDQDFAPPDGYQPLEDLLKISSEFKPAPLPTDDIPSPDQIQAMVVKQALDDTSGGTRMALRINEKLTPDCLGSTRFGSVTASLHQDFLMVASNAVNLIAPLIGPTTINDGTWVVPWLANLASANAGSATAPGAGLFSFIRQPRVTTLPPGSAGGGDGLLDRLAFRTLYERDSEGLLRTQREFTAGTLANTLSQWGILTSPLHTNILKDLMDVSGDLSMLSSIEDQRVITEGYETRELGVFTVSGLPGTMLPFSFGSMSLAGITTPPLFTVGLTRLTGTVDFSSLSTGSLITAATIGNVGNVVLGLSLPTTTLAAMVTRAPTRFGGAVLNIGSLGFCLAFPFLCPLAVSLSMLAGFVMTNVTDVTAMVTGVTWTLNIRFDFDPVTERVEPFVSLLARTGTVTIGALGKTPNLIANMVDSLFAAFGSLFDAWGALLADLGTKAIQQALRDQGIQLPVAGRQNELRATGGGAESIPGTILLLSADVRPLDDVASLPYTTQVVPSGVAITNGMTRELSIAHQTMRNDLNQVLPITLGTFIGIGLSQNALNCYIFQQWIQRRFEVTITDPVIIKKFLASAPPQLLVPLPLPISIHIWSATSPRIEIASHEIALGTRPLVVFFDDVRACFETPGVQGSDGAATVGVRELSCNFKASATIELAWPWVFGLRIDPTPPSSSVYEPRTWELVHTNNPAIMNAVAPQNLGKLVDLIADMLIAPISAVNVRAPAQIVKQWNRPLPAMQQEVFQAVLPSPLLAQQIYLEMLARRKALYVLPVINTMFIDLFNGSQTNPLTSLNLALAVAKAPGPIPTTLRAMTRAQGTSLKNYLLPITDLLAGP